MADGRAMLEKTDTGPRCRLVIRPPKVIAPDLDVVAFDLTFGASGRIPAQAPLLCLGGHPAAECLLQVEGTGQTHPVSIAIDRSSHSHLLMIERMRELFDPSLEIQVVQRPSL